MVIYTTKEYKGYGKQNYYYYEYRYDGGEVSKYKCHRSKVFDGDESNWYYDEEFIESWDENDSSMPGWLHQYIPD